MPWSPDPPARGAHDFHSLENDIAYKLIAGRRPLQICSQMGERQDGAPPVKWGSKKVFGCFWSGKMMKHEGVVRPLSILQGEIGYQK